MSGALAPLAVRAGFGYLALLALLRLSGKRTVAQGTPFDFVLALILGDTVDNLIWGEITAARFVAAVGTLTLVHLLVAWAQSVSPLVSRVVSGSPTLLLSHGQPRERGLRKEHVAESELEELLRLYGVPRERWSEVERALLETSGEASVGYEPLDQPATRGDVEGRPG